MKDAKSSDEFDQFLDASDEFPFYDCPDSIDSSHGESSRFSGINISGEGLRRRQSLQIRNLRDLKENIGSLDSDIVESSSETVVDGVNAVENESSTVSTVVSTENLPPPHSPSKSSPPQSQPPPLTSQQSSAPPSTPLSRQRSVPQFSASTGVRENDEDGESSSLGIVAEMLVKAIEFQLNLLISFVSFPFWVLYYSCMLVVNPLFIIGIGKSFLIGKLTRLCKFIGDRLSPYLSEWLNEHKSWLNLGLRCGWGLFWSVYVCSVLVILLIGAFVIGGVMMRYYVVEEPFQLKQGLSFDYTKSKPVAFVPILSCQTGECRDKNEIVNAAGFARVIPQNQKLQATVTMVLPESDYNRNLGMFQVRVEYLSENGKSLASISHPCMLEFKSQPLRLLLTFFKIIPLVAGYLSETQTLNLKFRGYKEGVIPTACLMITMEQRAEFQPAAGIPEVYNAFVHLESELPFFKRILWYWRRTIFVWLSMMVFTVELLCALVCCRPVIFPRARTESNVNRRNTHSTTHSARR